MNRFQTLRIVLLMLLLAAASVAAYLFFRHELYFCLLFSLLIVLGIILYVCQWQQKTTLMVARMIEGIRYSDFSLSFSCLFSLFPCLFKYGKHFIFSFPLTRSALQLLPGRK